MTTGRLCCGIRNIRRVSLWLWGRRISRGSSRHHHWGLARMGRCPANDGLRHLSTNRIKPTHRILSNHRVLIRTCILSRIGLPRGRSLALIGTGRISP